MHSSLMKGRKPLQGQALVRLLRGSGTYAANVYQVESSSREVKSVSHSKEHVKSFVRATEPLSWVETVFWRVTDFALGTLRYPDFCVRVGRHVFPCSVFHTFGNDIMKLPGNLVVSPG